jgi:hypothetical protein
MCINVTLPGITTTNARVMLLLTLPIKNYRVFGLSLSMMTFTLKVIIVSSNWPRHTDHQVWYFENPTETLIIQVCL